MHSFDKFFREIVMAWISANFLLQKTQQTNPGKLAQSVYRISKKWSIIDESHQCAPPPLCDQMDFTLKFEAKSKCNNMKYVESHFYQILLVLKCHRCLWNNIFETEIFWSNLVFLGIFMLLQMSVSKISAHRRLWYFKTAKNL